MRFAWRRAGPFLVGPLLAAVAAGAAGAGALQTPPPTPVPPGGSPSPFITSLQTPSPPAARPRIRAASAVLADLDTGQVLFERSPDHRRPIASLTKIMTALLVLERTRPGEVVVVGPDVPLAKRASLGLSELGLRAGERITVGELTFALLLQSANDAAVALAEHVARTSPAFVAAMNRRAAALGLHESHFASPNGLDDDGYSTAADLVALTRTAMANPRFARVVGTEFHTVISITGPKRIVQNRNVLLWLYPGATGVKTGFTTAAGFNVVATAERGGRRLIAVTLGEPGEPFSDAAALLNYGFGGFRERTVVESGQPFGTVALQGGSVDVEAGGALHALVPTSAHAPDRTVRVRPDAKFPPAIGDQVAVVRVSFPGVPAETVPLVVSGVPPPAPPSSGPWWRRAAGAVAGGIGALVRGLLS